jgi:cytochrome P450
MQTQLPPGPKVPAIIQTIAWWLRPIGYLERCRERYGGRFTLRMLGQPPFVMLYTAAEIKELFLAPPDLLHPGEGAQILEPIVGRHSVILLDEDAHMEQRKLMLPAFHGEKMQRLAGLMSELVQREVSSWPCEEPLALHPRLQQLTLEIVLRAVFGLERGERLDELRGLLTEILAFSESPLSVLPFTRDSIIARGPWARQRRLSAQADALIFDLIDERRRAEADGEDVLTLLLAARHEDDTPMSPVELRDELMTALVAGHETTASQLAWAFERLCREPVVVERLVGELDTGAAEDYLTATINEVMRRRPVLIHAEPRMTKQAVRIGDFDYPAGVMLFPNAYLLHHDPDIYPDPYAFRPERFLQTPPGTYTFIPFGGGRRRCLGASFALLEMKLVLRAVFERYEIKPVGSLPESASRRSIAISPSNQTQVVLHERVHSATGSNEVLAGASAAARAM